MRCIRVQHLVQNRERIAQGRPIDIDDVKTEKCGINYFCDLRLACEILTDKKDDSSVCLARPWSEKYFCLVSLGSFSLRVIFFCIGNATTLKYHERVKLSR